LNHVIKYKENCTYPNRHRKKYTVNSDEIKKKYLSGEMGSQRKKCRTAKFPEVDFA
jgi:hypothetical protein